MIFDPDTGMVLEHERAQTAIEQTVKRWLEKPAENVIQLPRNPLIGISLAIAGHSFWNGSLWIISWLFIDSSDLLFVIANLAWTAILVGMLWILGREILASVKHLPS